MSPSSEASPSLLKRYQIHLGVGLLLVFAFGLVLMPDDGTDGRKDLHSADRHARPPMPTIEVEGVENDVIEQVEVDYDASLDLAAVASAR